MVQGIFIAIEIIQNTSLALGEKRILSPVNAMPNSLYMSNQSVQTY